jgi:hypothetical protein
LTDGIGEDSVLECMGTKEAMTQIIQCARPGAIIGYAGVQHGVELDGQGWFFSQTGMLIDLVLDRKIEPSKVFDLTPALADVAELPRDRRAARDQDPCCRLVSGLKIGGAGGAIPPCWRPGRLQVPMIATKFGFDVDPATGGRCAA